ncbi:MAG TPA: hypothetical protein VFN49_02915 [Candidatus Aquilonibacter sp.]|nr:hypothetical protein [Candidatus Aquilonibacter sp.]
MDKRIVLGVLCAMLTACGGGGGGGGSSSGGSVPSGPPQATKTAPPVIPNAHVGVAVFGDDSYGPGALDVVSLFDGNGQPLPSPAVVTIALPYMFDLEDIAISPDASIGLIADGARTLRVFTGLAARNPVISSTILDVSAHGNDLDAVRLFNNGDEAVISADTDSQLYVVSGVRSGAPVFAQAIATPDLRNGLVLSSDDSVLLARGYSGVTVYAVAATTPQQGLLGGWIYHSFTETGNFTAVPVLDAADARGGMASDPADVSRAIVVGGSSLVELTGLPNSAAASSAVPISGARNSFAVAISPDGTTAFVGTDAGIAVFSGVNTGTPAQTQSVTVPGSNGDTLQQLSNVQVTSDGKYLVVVGRSAQLASGSNGYLVVLPIVSGKLGAPVTTVTNVPVPDNNQLLVQ